jgi:D-alanine-D-alanine ligase
MRWPFIVKRPNGYASIGMDAKSKVKNLDELQAKVEQLAKEYPDDAKNPGAANALVEEFIEGREFTVLVAEPLGRRLAKPGRKTLPRAWHPIECRFPNGEEFKHYDLKWVTFEGIQWLPVDDDVLAQRLIEATRKLFAALHGTGYARCDLRMDREGHIYMLEINPNPGIFYPEAEFGSADFILVNDGGFPAFLDHVFQLALARQAALQKQIAMRKAMSLRGSLARRRRMQVVKQA